MEEEKSYVNLLSNIWHNLNWKIISNYKDHNLTKISQKKYQPPPALKRGGGQTMDVWLGSEYTSGNSLIKVKWKFYKRKRGSLNYLKKKLHANFVQRPNALDIKFIWSH